MNSTQIPAIVGIGSTEMGLLSLGLSGRSRRPTKPHTLQWNHTTYLTGAGVERYTRPIKERLDFARLADGPEARAMTYTSLGTLLGAGQHTVSLLIGLPVALMADRLQARETLKTLRAWLVGHHQFSLDGQEVELLIEQVRILAQPAGTFFAWGFDDQGQWVQSKEELNALIGICDIGFNTVDLFGVQGGEVLRDYTAGDTAGVRRAAELLIQQVETYQVQLSHHEADAYLQASRPVLSCAAGEIDLQMAVSQAIDVAAGQVIALLNERWEQAGRFRYMLFTGGGALLFKAQLEKAYSRGLVLPEAVSANALGLARYARRIFKDAEVVIGLDPGYGGFKAVSLGNSSLPASASR
ncbi:MAG: ParM/StbA family protein [Anaerolineales bacterium]|nr:ParM/StbA family protein [Anaerolineales bacterium]